MSLEIQQYKRADKVFETIKVVEAGDMGERINAFKVKGKREVVLFQCEIDDSGSTIYRFDPKSRKHEVVKRLGKGESFGMAIVRSARNAEPTLYNITHR